MDHQGLAQLLGNYGEFIGAIAVVATLIYLTLQIRQHSVQMRLNSFQIATERYTGNIANVLDSPVNFEIFREGLHSYLSLPPERQAQFHVHLVRGLYAYQNNLVLNRAGALSDEVLDQQKTDLARILMCPGAMEWSESLRFEPDWQVRWNALISDIRGSDQNLIPLNQALPFLSSG